MAQTPKSEVFCIRLTSEQLKALKRLAAQQGKQPSVLVRDLVFREMGRAIAA